MGRFITIWGSPNSGKTTLALQIASKLSRTKNAQTVVISPDYETPVLSYLFPMRQNKDLASLGETLNRVNVVSEDIYENMIIPKGNDNLGILGFKDKENRFSYETFTAESITETFNELRKIADYIIIDCNSNLENNLLSNLACQLSDIGIRLKTPDMKCMSWYGSQMEIYNSQHYNIGNQIEVLNINDFSVNPTEIEAKDENVKFVLPYCKDLRKRMQEGNLTECTNDSKYSKILNQIINAVI